MQIVLNDIEEEAVRNYGIKHKITYGEALQRIIDAMTKGLMELAREDDEIGTFESTTKIETLDNMPSDSDSD
jgi:hypothetical protein